MRLNAKTAKEMRAAAKYRNQSATPSKPEFPGVARLYKAPVYATSTKVETSYEMRDGKMVKVLRNVKTMAQINHRHKRPTPVLVLDTHTQEPKLEMIPVTKPVHATGEKKVYRGLKRLYRKGLLDSMYTELYEAAMPAHLREEAA